VGQATHLKPFQMGLASGQTSQAFVTVFKYGVSFGHPHVLVFEFHSDPVGQLTHLLEVVFQTLGLSQVTHVLLVIS